MRRISVLLSCLVLLVTLLVGAGVSAAPARIPYWVTVDLVRGESNAVGPVGVQTSVFKQGEEVVFRARVLEIPGGGDPGGAGRSLNVIRDRGLKVTAHLATGMTISMSYTQQPPGAKGVWFWMGSWKIPADHPPGQVKYWIMVTDKTGASVRWDPIGAGTLLPPIAIIIEKR